MVASWRDGTVLYIVDGVSPISVDDSFEGNHVYFEGFFEAHHKEDTRGMEFETPFVIETFFPAIEIDAILCFDKVVCQPRAAMQFFETLLAN